MSRKTPKVSAKERRRREKQRRNTQRMFDNTQRELHARLIAGQSASNIDRVIVIGCSTGPILNHNISVGAFAVSWIDGVSPIEKFTFTNTIECPAYTELQAIKFALEVCMPDESLMIISDSKHINICLTKEWTPETTTPLDRLNMEVLQAVRARTKPVIPMRPKNHWTMSIYMRVLGAAALARSLRELEYALPMNQHAIAQHQSSNQPTIQPFIPPTHILPFQQQSPVVSLPCVAQPLLSSKIAPQQCASNTAKAASTLSCTETPSLNLLPTSTEPQSVRVTGLAGSSQPTVHASQSSAVGRVGRPLTLAVSSAEIVPRAPKVSRMLVFGNPRLVIEKIERRYIEKKKRLSLEQEDESEAVAKRMKASPDSQNQSSDTSKGQEGISNGWIGSLLAWFRGQ